MPVPSTPQTAGLQSQQRPLSSATGKATLDPIVKIEEVQELISGKSGKKYTLIDVREPAEVSDSGVIPTAHHIPVNTLLDALQLPASEFQAKYNFAKPTRDDHVVFYCRSGRRSALAYDIAKGLGYGGVRNYSGSWLEWEKCGGPVEKK
ncbi:hypothetical protein HK104_005891 [Borealophlyctis nickersoniae]|nr:hypothetical protein HK104_005891 [Borealophlyctis nickersoniae]